MKVLSSYGYKIKSLLDHRNCRWSSVWPLCWFRPLPRPPLEAAPGPVFRILRGPISGGENLVSEAENKHIYLLRKILLWTELKAEFSI
jgi:hypothetical protein